jgi:hypothetical protein
MGRAAGNDSASWGELLGNFKATISLPPGEAKHYSYEGGIKPLAIQTQDQVYSYKGTFLRCKATYQKNLAVSILVPMKCGKEVPSYIPSLLLVGGKCQGSSPSTRGKFQYSLRGYATHISQIASFFWLINLRACNYSTITGEFSAC